MLDWLYECTLDVSVLITVVLLIRNPVRRIMGAHISYWLWSLPLLRLIFSNKFERPEVMTKYLNVPATNDFIPVYYSPLQSSEIQLEILTIIWVSGLIIWGLFKLMQTMKFKSLLRQYSAHVPKDHIMTADLSDQFKINVEFKQCAAVEGPLITGLIKPQVFLPNDFFETYNQQQRQHIVLHEMTHAKRKDLWAQLLAEFFKAIFWFNPLVHLAWSKFQQDQEMACDRQVLKHANSQTRLEYGETLSKGLSAILTPNSLTFFNHKHERFVMLSKHKNNRFISLAGFMLITIIAYVLLTETKISFAEKSIETNGSIVSYNFKEIPLLSVAMLVADASGGVANMQGLDVMKGIFITAQAERVYAFDFFDAVLKDNNLQVTRNDDTWLFSKY